MNYIWKENLSAAVMKVRELCFIAVIGALEFVMFTSFSFVLYLECITLTVLLFSMVFQTRVAVLGAIVFGIINFSMQGVTPWSIMYVLIYPIYSLLIGCLKPYLRTHFIVIVMLCAFLSFLTGQLVQLPFMLVSDKITMLYILAGLKTSLIQGVVSGITCFICYKPIYVVLKKIEGRLHYEKNY
ncbi:cytochrome B [Amedibacillus sp. YH-ame10]